MAAISRTRSVDRTIWELARRQHNSVGRWQLLDRGLTRHEIQGRIESGRLTEVHKGVYMIGAVPSEHTFSQAALLAMKGEGTLSHFTAAHLWRLRSLPHLAHPWVTVPRRRYASRPSIHVIRADLDRLDLRFCHGMRVTSPPRAVLDCATLIDDDYEYEALVAEARYRGRASEKELAMQLDRDPGKRGAARLRRVLDLPGGPQRTRSGGERAFLRLLRDEQLGDYTVNSKVFGPELDFVWEGLRFVVEVDGWDGHSGKIAFERDRLKVAELQARDIQVMPVTSRQIRDDRSGVVRRLAASLRRRRES